MNKNNKHYVDGVVVETKPGLRGVADVLAQFCALLIGTVYSYSQPEPRAHRSPVITGVGRVAAKCAAPRRNSG